MQGIARRAQERQRIRDEFLAEKQDSSWNETGLKKSCNNKNSDLKNVGGSNLGVGVYYFLYIGLKNAIPLLSVMKMPSVLEIFGWVWQHAVSEIQSELNSWPDGNLR